MIQKRLGHQTEAMDWLLKANSLADAELEPDKVIDWLSKELLIALRRQATETVNSEK